MSFILVFIFCFSMIFLSTQIEWTGQILEEGPRLCLLLADRIGREIGPIGRAVFLLGFWGAAFSSVLGVYHGVPFLFDDMLHVWRRQPALGQQGVPYRAWAIYLGAAAISALLVRRPVWLVFAYTVVGSMFFPFVISTLLWLNNSTRVARGRPQRPHGQHAARRRAGVVRVSGRAIAHRVGSQPTAESCSRVAAGNRDASSAAIAAGSAGLVRCASKPAASARRRSSS